MAIADLVESAILTRGVLLLHAAPDALAEGLGVDSGGRPAVLEPVTEAEVRAGDPVFRRPFIFPAEGAALSARLLDGTPFSTGTEAYVNALPAWAVQNGRTLQMRVDTFDTAHVIRIEQALAVPAGDAPRRFEALIAAHRCEAALVVRFDPDPGTEAEPVSVEVPFEPRLAGGRSPEGYRAVSLPSPFGAAGVTVTLEIRYDRFRSDGDPDYPYIFLANPEVVAGAGGSRARLQPRHATLGGAGGGAWFRAIVDPFRRAADPALTLTLGAERLPVFAPDDNAVTLVDDYGHALVLRARAPLAGLLHIDGTPVGEIDIRPEETVIRLPATALRGEIVTVAVSDLSGSQIYLSLPVLAPRMLTPAEVMARESRPPYPTDLTVRANHRYRALRAHLADPMPGLDPGMLGHALDTLDAGYAQVTLAPLALPAVDDPEVSVVIPAHNHVAVTYTALCALIVARCRARFEVIVVDDGSTDATARIEDFVTGLRVVRLPEPQRFIRACNAGVAAARAEHVVLLNNDTEPTVGWLDALLDAFRRFDRVGIAGAKLVYPDGTLQDAGGIVWGSGNPWNYGNGGNPWDPRFCYARQADYLSGAALMVARAVWEHVGGLSAYLEPMYFEDTDLAFKVREAGFTTWFVPAAVVYHVEGATSGTDTSTGFKRYQEINRPRFKRRWARACAGFGRDGHEPDLEKDRGIAGRVLFVDHGIPREDRDAGSHAARREIELVQSLGYKVTFLPLNMAHLGAYTEDLERSGVEVIHAPFFLSAAEFIERRAAEFDAVYVTRYHVAQHIVPLVRRHAPAAKIILNNADLHFLRELRAAMVAPDRDPARIAAMRLVREQELAMMRQADLVLSYNEVEHAVIASHTDGEARVMTGPWVVEGPARARGPKGRRGLCFLGNYHHPPNAEGLRWFCAEVMPQLGATPLTLYGAGMDAGIRALASDTVTVAGHVATLAEAFDRHRIFVAPLLSGAGIKGKVLGALAHGIPCILSPVAAEGIGLRTGHDCLIATTPQEWAAAIGQLTDDDRLWAAIAGNARAYVADRYSFAAGRARMKAAFEAVDLFGGA